MPVSFTRHHAACLFTITLLAGCASGDAPQPQAVYTVPTAPAPPVPFGPPITRTYTAPPPQVAFVAPPEPVPEIREAQVFEIERVAVPQQETVDDPVEVAPPVAETGTEDEDDFAERLARALETGDADEDSPRDAIRAASAAADRANPPPANRRPQARQERTLGRFATRSLPQNRTPRPAARATPTPRPAPVVPQRSFAEVQVARAPVPNPKPFILRNAPAPSRKPAAAPEEAPQRSFAIVPAALLSSVDAQAVAPVGPLLPTEPGDTLGTRFFPTPGKPSTRGTDQDRSIDVVALDAARYGVGEDVTEAITDGSTVEWDDGVRLIEAGEVEGLSILEDSDLQLTLCSGRSVVTTPPDLAAAATLNAPQIICGQNKALAIR